jgi:hypothetical protein
VPAGLPVLDVGGLSSYARPHSFMRPRSAVARAATATSFAGSAPDGTSYMGYDFRTAYAPGTSLTGAGQNVALVQFDGYFPSDIAAYQQLTGLPAIPMTTILLDGFDGVPTMTGGESEVELDIEMVNSWAPGLSQLLVYEENPAVFDPVVVLNQIASDDAAKQVSCSWGWVGGPNATINQILQQMILQGQSFFQASGDSDAMLPGQVDDPTQEFSICADAYVTSVGGTTLTTDTGGNYTSEMVWNDRVPNPTAGDWGSGGGISTYYPTPIWQQGFGTVTNHGTASGRNFPDVALTANDVWVIYDDGQAGPFGGTSCAAPAWAGFTALVNQQAVANGNGPVGFINPAIYALAKTATYTNDFHDITLGDNTWPGSLTNFFAVPGYDLCTGLGTPNGTNLIVALAGGSSSSGPVVSPPKNWATWGTTLSVMNGSNPNGPWFLFVQDDKPKDIGLITNGWTLALTTANPVGNVADNQLYVNPASSSVTPGSYWTVSLAVTNYGPSASANVYVQNSLPLPGGGVTLQSSVPTAGSLSTVGNTLSWTVGNLPINAGAALTLSFYASANALGNYTNSAHVYANTSDPNPDDDSGAAILQVAGVSVPPQLTAGFNAGTGAFTLSVTGVTNQSAIIQASTNLVSGVWTPVYTNLIPFTFTNFDSTNYLMRFYRTVLGQ